MITGAAAAGSSEKDLSHFYVTKKWIRHSREGGNPSVLIQRT
jgi:hypothetical protein